MHTIDLTTGKLLNIAGSIEDILLLEYVTPCRHYRASTLHYRRFDIFYFTTV